MSLVTAIMTSYNYRNCISKAIESVLDQTFSDFFGEPLIKYRVHGKNATFRDTLGWDRDNIKFNEPALERFGPGMSGKLKSRLFCLDGMFFSRIGRIGPALGCLSRGVLLYPLHAYYVLIPVYLTTKNAFRRGHRRDGNAPVA